jgi:hypothetical protein
MEERIYQHQITGQIIRTILPIAWVKNSHYYIEIFEEKEREEIRKTTDIKQIKTLNLFKQ